MNSTKFTNDTVTQFRTDFHAAVAALEKEYGCYIKLGTIRYDGTSLRSTMKAEKGVKPVYNTVKDFNLGDKVRINHKTVDSGLEFIVIKINKKSIKVENAKTKKWFKVSANLLETI